MIGRNRSSNRGNRIVDWLKKIWNECKGLGSVQVHPIDPLKKSVDTTQTNITNSPLEEGVNGMTTTNITAQPINILSNASIPIPVDLSTKKVEKKSDDLPAAYVNARYAILPNGDVILNIVLDHNSAANIYGINAQLNAPYRKQVLNQLQGLGLPSMPQQIHLPKYDNQKVIPIDKLLPELLSELRMTLKNESVYAESVKAIVIVADVNFGSVYEPAWYKGAEDTKKRREKRKEQKHYSASRLDAFMMNEANKKYFCFGLKKDVEKAFVNAELYPIFHSGTPDVVNDAKEQMEAILATDNNIDIQPNNIQSKIFNNLKNVEELYEKVVRNSRQEQECHSAPLPKKDDLSSPISGSDGIVNSISSLKETPSAIFKKQNKTNPDEVKEEITETSPYISRQQRKK